MSISILLPRRRLSTLAAAVFAALIAVPSSARAQAVVAKWLGPAHRAEPRAETNADGTPLSGFVLGSVGALTGFGAASGRGFIGPTAPGLTYAFGYESRERVPRLEVSLTALVRPWEDLSAPAFGGIALTAMPGLHFQFGPVGLNVGAGLGFVSLSDISSAANAFDLGVSGSGEYDFASRGFAYAEAMALWLPLSDLWTEGASFTMLSRFALGVGYRF